MVSKTVTLRSFGKTPEQDTDITMIMSDEQLEKLYTFGCMIVKVEDFKPKMVLDKRD